MSQVCFDRPIIVLYNSAPRASY